MYHDGDASIETAALQGGVIFQPVKNFHQDGKISPDAGGEFVVLQQMPV